MQTASLSLLIVLIVLVLVLIFIFVFKKSVKSTDGVRKTDLENLKLEFDKTNSESSSELKVMLLENMNKQQESLYSVQNNFREIIAEKTRETQDKLVNANEIVRSMISKVAEQSLPIAEVKEKVNKLDNLLSQNNKAGSSGEYLLERIFSNLTGFIKNHNLIYERQYTMKKLNEGKKLIVDLFIKGDDSKFVNIPIDSKFPFNAYTALLNAEVDSNNYKDLVKQFEKDVNARVKETSKYVSSEDNTVYAIMFVPSEGIFSYINANTDIIDSAYKKKVIIAGPSTLMAILQSVDKYMSLFDDISKFDKKVEVLIKTMKYIENYDAKMEELFSNIVKLSKSYEEVKVKETSLKNIYKKLLNESNIEEISEIKL
ncbi:DNA recombination protein RmuC [Spiroplasma apis]|uniref:DNA recombination protein RmuC n=1 Tax=Spiroplasma apis B31 TaxID=1276258 RepID=V5RIB2_SPIAP|nr:DNA recombination protein RmuC [Spiroplasma apis]AHB36427.1 hypothetical protein SAPIS_v1c05820 [Spiroplasma apis B31]